MERTLEENTEKQWEQWRLNRYVTDMAPPSWWPRGLGRSHRKAPACSEFWDLIGQFGGA
jgi:hypothetical protein